MSMPKIVERGLTHKEAREFSNLITKTPNIIGYLPNELTKLKASLVIEDEGEAKGILAYVETDKFVDLKLFIVKEASRGAGLGSKLFDEFMKKFTVSNKPIYCITRNKSVISMLARAGFVRISLQKLPLAYITHQLRMAFSFYRFKEYIRKLLKFHGQDSFSYYIRYPK